jgi:putative ABC transport system permease protein
MDTLLQDIRYAFRMMAKNPVFTAVAVLTLAIGIGVNTAMFSVVDAVLLRPLPFPDSSRLVKIMFDKPGVGLHDVRFSYNEFDDLKTRAGVFDEVSVVWPSSGNLTGTKVPARLELLAVSPNYFSMLGAVPELGRLFGTQDFALGFAEAAVISDSLWRRSYGADPTVIGRHLQIDNDPYTIVGVLAPGFSHPGKTVSGDVEVWLTAGFSADPFKAVRGVRELPGAMGRLKSGITFEQAQAKLTAMASQLQKDYPTDYPAVGRWTIEIQPLRQSLVGEIRPMLVALMGAVILIILLASVNIANLLLARASARQREIAMRLALGASRSRIVWQTLTESAILSFIAGIVGVVCVVFTLKVMLRLVPSNIPRLHEVGVNWTVLAFALLISVVTGILFGLAPAFQSAKIELLAAVREGAQGSGYSASVGRMRGLLVGSELAIAAVLMIGAGLLLRTFWTLLQESPGFNPSHVVVAGLWLPVPNDPKTDKYEGVGNQMPFIREVMRRVSAIPGIELAGMTSALPTSAGRPVFVQLDLEDRPVESSADLRAEVIRVTPNYFKVMETPLLSGRFFEEGDEMGKEFVAILDESTAKRYWPGESAIGKHLKIVADATVHPVVFTVVGIVADIKHDGLDKDGVPHLYASMYQRSGRIMSVAVRTPLSAETLEPQITGAIQSVDPNLPVFGIRTMDEVIGVSLAPRRFSAELVAVFAGLALLLASLGIYGLLAYIAGQRRREIGIRMALGAKRADILRLFLTRGILRTAIGIGGGLLAAAIIAPAIASLLYGVRPMDPTVFLAVPMILFVVSVLASYIPALRASRVDPMKTLRQE